MADPNNRNGAGGSGGGDAGWNRAVFQHVPLTLSARLANGRVTIEQLRTIAPGAVLPLETAVGEPSRLVADGSVVAVGEVVEIQGHLALRLTRLGEDAHD